MASFKHLALCVLLFATLSVVNSKKLVLRAAYTKEELNPSPGYPNAPTSYQVLGGRLYLAEETKAEKLIGYSNGQSTFVRDFQGEKVFLLHFVYVILGQGKIVVDGDMITSNKVNDLAAVGGSGKWKFAKGQALRTALKPSEFRFKNSAAEALVELDLTGY